VLQRHRNHGAERLHQPGDGRSCLGHADEDLARLAVGIQPDGEIAFMSGNREVVRYGCARPAADGGWQAADPKGPPALWVRW
jgi:hypothetical protein